MDKLQKFDVVSKVELAKVNGGKLVHYAYGVTYNTRTGKTSVDPAGFASYWSGNVIGLAVGAGTNPRY
jgi:hypothetical protein